MGELFAANPFPRTVSGDQGQQASAIAGAAANATGAAAGNVSLVFATQYWRVDHLTLSVVGLPTTGPAWSATAELIDASHDAGTVISASVGGASGGSTASLSIPF